MVDKFTKRIKAKPVTSCNGATARRFVENVIIRFGYPHSIITDNGSNFSMGKLAEFCEEQGIRLDIASVAHPQANGQVERTNGLILHGIQPRNKAPLRRAVGS